MKQKTEITGMLLCWFAIITQFILMMQNREANVIETIIRFFSFFTILTNLLVGLYFTTKVFRWSRFPFGLCNKKRTLTAITSFILIVGLVYQVVLRKLWTPTGFQFIVDELLHTIIPLFVLIYWFLTVKTADLNLKSVSIWLLYPIFFLLFILIRGSFSNFYPYPFLDVTEIGYQRTFINAGIIFCITLFVMGILLLIGKVLTINQLQS